ARMYDAAATSLQQKLSQAEGVGQVNVSGGSPPAVRVDLNPTVLNHYGLALADLRTALGAANTNRPKGQIADDDRAWSVSSTDQLFQAKEYAPLIVAFRNGAPIRVQHVATVSDSVEDIRATGLCNGSPSVAAVLFAQLRRAHIAVVD